MNNILTAPVSGDIVNQYLCGGTFFSLMLRLGIVSDKSTGRKIADREVFKGLTEAVTGVDLTTPKNTLGIYTSYYRGCKDISYSTPLRDLAVAYQYHHTVMNNYEVAKRWMESFVRKFIDPRKKEILVRSILELINNDTNILPSQHFYVVNSETYMTKYQLIIEDSFDLASFFVGIMNFILTERLSSNHLGIDTINYWDRQNERQRGSISSSVNSYYFGASIKHDIHVIYPKDEPTLEKANPAFPAPMNLTPLDNYLQAIMADLTEVHTVINQGNPAKFDEIYVETNLLPVISDDDDPDESVTAISDITIQKLEEFGHRIKIVGIGGLGKTMLIRNKLYPAEWTPIV